MYFESPFVSTLVLKRFQSKTTSVMLLMTRANLIGLLFTVILAILFLYTSFKTGFGPRQLNYKKGKDCRRSHNLCHVSIMVERFHYKWNTNDFFNRQFCNMSEIINVKSYKVLLSPSEFFAWCFEHAYQYLKISWRLSLDICVNIKGISYRF